MKERSISKILNFVSAFLLCGIFLLNAFSLEGVEAKASRERGKGRLPREGVEVQTSIEGVEEAPQASLEGVEAPQASLQNVEIQAPVESLEAQASTEGVEVPQTSLQNAGAPQALLESGGALQSSLQSVEASPQTSVSSAETQVSLEILVAGQEDSIARELLNIILSRQPEPYGLPGSSFHYHWAQFMMTVLAAEQNGYIGRAEAIDRLSGILSIVTQLEKYYGFAYDSYAFDTLQPTTVGVNFQGWYLYSLIVIKNTYPELAVTCQSLLDEVDYYNSGMYNQSEKTLAQTYYAGEGPSFYWSLANSAASEIRIGYLAYTYITGDKTPWFLNGEPLLQTVEGHDFLKVWHNFNFDPVLLHNQLLEYGYYEKSWDELIIATQEYMNTNGMVLFPIREEPLHLWPGTPFWPNTEHRESMSWLTWYFDFNAPVMAKAFITDYGLSRYYDNWNFYWTYGDNVSLHPYKIGTTENITDGYVTFPFFVYPPDDGLNPANPPELKSISFMASYDAGKMPNGNLIIELNGNEIGQVSPSQLSPEGDGWVYDRQWNTNLSSPHGVCVDGDVYIANNLGWNVAKFSDVDGTWERAIGTFGTDEFQFLGVADVCMFDSELYVVDASNGNYVVQVFNTSGVGQRTWGTGGSGNDEYLYASGIHVVGDEVYVTDTGNYRIKVTDTSGTYARQWGSQGSGDSQFEGVVGITVYDSEVYTTDYVNDRVQVFALDGTYARQWGSTGTGDGEFDTPNAICVDTVNEYVYVGDSGNHRVQIFETDGTYLGQFGSEGTGNGQFLGVAGIDFYDGEIFVTDGNSGINRIQVFVKELSTSPTPIEIAGIDAPLFRGGNYITFKNADSTTDYTYNLYQYENNYRFVKYRYPDTNNVIASLDTLDDLEQMNDADAQISIFTIPGYDGDAVAIDYDFSRGGNWVQISKDCSDIDISDGSAIQFYYRAVGNQADLEVKLEDIDGTIYGYRFNDIDYALPWTPLSIPYVDFSYYWGGKDDVLDTERIKSIWFAIIKTSDDSVGSFNIDHVTIDGNIGVTTELIPPAIMEVIVDGQRDGEENPMAFLSRVAVAHDYYVYENLLDDTTFLDSLVGWVGDYDNQMSLAPYIHNLGSSTVEVSYDRPDTWTSDSLIQITDITDNIDVTDTASFGPENIYWPALSAHTYKIEYLSSGVISGIVTLQGRSDHSKLITFELRNPGETTPISTYQVITASDGSYVLSNIIPGTYDLTAKASNFLRAKQSNVTVVTEEETPDIDFSLLGGDCDGNNIVSLMDFSILRAAYGSSIGDPLWNEEADFNGNGQVDLTDFSILRSNYGTSGAQ